MTLRSLPPLVRPLARVAPLALVALLAACSSTTSVEAPAPPPADQTPTDVHADFHFFSERDGFAKETRSIVFTDRFHVRVDGVPANAEVTIGLSLYSPFEKGRGYTSSATFVADGAGRVDTGAMAPVRGSYHGVDPDGLVWSAVEGPLAEGLGVRTSAFFQATIGDEVVGEGELARTSTAAGVTIESVRDDGLVGALYLPAGATGAVGRVPVVAFGGSEGGLDGGSFYAMQIASWGHPVLAVAYFGAPGVPEELEEIPLEYFQKAFQWLDRRPEMRKGKHVVIGGSRGGELALQLGATFPNVIGVIAQTPSSYRWAGLSTLHESAAWTFAGKPLAWVPSSPAARPGTTTTPDGDVAYVLTPLFQKDVVDAPPDALEAARIPVEQSEASILMIGGSDDALWPACDFIARAMKRLEDSGHKAAHHDEGICHPGAGHSVGSAGLPMTRSMWADLQGTVYALGGTAEANGRAGRATSDKVKEFLARVTQ